MKKILLPVLFSVAVAVCRADGPYHLIKEIPVGGDGGWDALTVDSAAQRLYVSHAARVVVIDLAKDQVAGEITNTPGVHGIAVAPKLNRGFTSNGRENKVSIVDLKTLQTLSKVDTGTNPDAIFFEPGQNEVYAFNGRGQSATVIDAKSGKVVATIPLGGKPEFAEGDAEAHRVFNNLEDKSEVAVINTRTHSVTNRWPIAPGEDGSAFDPGTQLVFASCGDGTTTIAHEDAPDKLTVVQTLETQRGSRTIALDPKTHKIYLPTAQFEPQPEQAAGAPRQRPKMVPDTFKILVYGMEK
jgi:YVTN family beta-propeller protein